MPERVTDAELSDLGGDNRKGSAIPIVDSLKGGKTKRLVSTDRSVTTEVNQ